MAGPDLRTPEALARAMKRPPAITGRAVLDDADRICTRVLKAAPDGSTRCTWRAW